MPPARANAAAQATPARGGPRDTHIIYSSQVLMEGREDDIVNDPEDRRLYLGDDFRF